MAKVVSLGAAALSRQEANSPRWAATFPGGGAPTITSVIFPNCPDVIPPLFKNESTAYAGFSTKTPTTK